MHIRTKHTLKAFTVLELLVGLVISSIVIGMLYTIYVQINRQLLLYNKDQIELMEFNQFKQVFSKDILLASNVQQHSANELSVEFSNAIYKYKFSNAIVVRDRNGVEKDTFNVAVKAINLKGNARTYVSIEVLTSILGQPISLFESKEVSIEDRINKVLISEY